MKQLLLIFLGGGTGSVLRYYLGKLLQGYFAAGFPFGTLGVNVLACFILGLVAGIGDSAVNLSPSARLLLITGFCGGLSTFSAFSYESLRLMQEGKYIYLATYVIVSIVLCIAVTFAGIALTSRIT